MSCYFRGPLLTSAEGAIHEMMAEIDPYFRSGEINSRVSSVSEVIDKVKGAFPDGQQDMEDGLTVQYPDFWFNLRPSNTEPLLRLNIEAVREDILEEKKNDLLSIIRT